MDILSLNYFDKLSPKIGKLCSTEKLPDGSLYAEIEVIIYVYIFTQLTLIYSCILDTPDS